jgi:hypothetical protein
MRVESNNWSSPSSGEHGRSDFCECKIGTKLGSSRCNGQCKSSGRNRSVKTSTAWQLQHQEGATLGVQLRRNVKGPLRDVQSSVDLLHCAILVPKPLSKVPMCSIIVDLNGLKQKRD